MVNYDHFYGREPRTNPPVRSYPLVEDIERRTCRVVSIETTLTTQNLAKCALQLQSPLWRLPAELRSTIFEYACHCYEDDECRYKESTACQFYRPEHQARHITSTSLLITCRLAWLETNHLPLQLGDHSFFFRDQFAVSARPHYLADINASEDNRLKRFLTGLTVNNRNNLKHLHLYAWPPWLEQCSGLKCVQMLSVASACPEVLTITIRGSDWNGWEIFKDPPRMDDTWLENFLQWPASQRLREIRLELEAGERKAKWFNERTVPHLEAIVRHLCSKFAVLKRVDRLGTPVNVVLQHTAESLPTATWNGIALQPGHNGMQCCTMWAQFTMKTLVWKVVPEEEESTGGSAAVCNTSARVQEQDLQLPLANVNQSCQIGDGPRLSLPGPAVLLRGATEWQESGSLLKFAPDSCI